jgi:signal peptidase I
MRVVAPSLPDLAATFLQRGNTLRVRARGDSMLPFLRHGDVLHVRRLPAADVRVGDVICYAPSPGRLHLHRVVARDERGFVTRGDALPYVEDVPATRVLGRVIARERRGRLRRLDTRAARRCNRAIVAAAPLTARVLPLARALRRAWRTVRRG